MRFLKLLVSVVLIILIAWSLKLFLFKESDYNTDSQTSGQAEGPSITEQVQSFSISGFSKSGEKAWQVEGKSANILSDVIDLTDINADSYSDDTNANLKADEGVFYRRTNNILLKKNVIIVTDEGTTLTTDSLDWDDKAELISTEDHVYIKRKDMDADGTGALAKPNLKKARLNNDVTVITQDPAAVITCDGPLEIDYEANIAYFNRNVKLVDKETTIDTDKATAYFDPKKRALSKVICQGNVKILRGEDITYAEELTYMPGEGRVLLTGRPKIIIQSAEELIKEHKEKKNGSTKDREPS
ncbi:MAG: LPS export ABC transporter periplasmic protein LptC [Candidatus Omnitrophica bacterium]|nr:LPS export ABC transporter periplasmic protein LptC [Candidatus Omnitrophota bacterium]